MADEIRKKIVVDVSGAVDSLDDMKAAAESADYSFKSLGDAKKYIDRLKASLIDMDETSKEYEDTVKEIDTVQEKLNKAMKATGTTAKNAEGSYNALSKQMSELKRAFKETNDEAEREVLAKQIAGINTRLKEMDSSIGNYQRNVGNYEGAFTKGLDKLGGKIGGLKGPLAAAKSGVAALSGAFKALLANPIGLVITGIVTVLGALRKAFKGSEEASNKMKVAFSAFRPIINAVKNAFSALAKGIAAITEKAIPALVNGLMDAGMWLTKMANKIGLVSDERLKAYQLYLDQVKKGIADEKALTEREIQLEKDKRDMKVETSKMELQIEELRMKAADKAKYSAKERAEFDREALRLSSELGEKRVALAKEEYEIALERSKQTENSSEDLDNLAEKEAAYYDARKEQITRDRSLIRELGKAQKELSADQQKALEEAKKREEEREKILKRLETAFLNEKDRELKILEDKYKEEDTLLAGNEEAQLKLKQEYEQKKKEIEEQYLQDINDINIRASQSLMTKEERDLDILRRQYEEEKELFEKKEQDTTLLTEEYEKKKQEIKDQYKDQKVKEIEDEATLQMYLVDKTVQNEYDKNQQLLEIDRKRLEDEKGVYEELLGQDDISAEKKEEYKQKLAKINADIVANDKKTKDQQIKHIQGLINQYAQMAQSIGNVMNEVAGIWQDSIKEREKSGKITEKQAKKEFEKTKKLQIAGAIINGLAGIAMAISTAMSLGPILGPIMGAINGTMVAVTTAAQIAKIKQTQYEGSGEVSATDATAATSAIPSIEATAYSPDYQASVTGESETENLANAVNEGQRDQRVYVVESDIAEAGKRVEVRETESTF